MLDPFGRSIRYLRISVTDRCNLRCTYCRPPGDIEPSFHTRVLSYEELLRVCGIFWRLGFDKFRLTGGEPLVRRDFVPFVSRLRSRLPDAALGCTTNGLLFARYAESLKVAGLDRVNFSLDSLRPSTFRLVTGSDGLERVLEGIDAALAQDFRKVKINVVVMRGVNHEEIPAFVDRFGDRPLYIRFIEFMPYGINNWDATRVYPYASILADLQSRFRLLPRAREEAGPSRDFDVEGARCRVGIISPLTRSFCADCNRLRLTSDGKLRACLFSEEEVDLRSLLRSGSSDDSIVDAIRSAVAAKPKDHNLSADTITPAHFQRVMRQVGG